MQDKLKPALIGGLALGVASGTPIISMGNCICCAWVIGGGVLSTYLYLREAGPSAQAPYGDAALVGILTGLVGAVTSAILGALFSMIFSAGDAFGQLSEILGEQEDIPPEVQEMLSGLGAGGGGCIGFFISLMVLGVLYPIFATGGAMLATAIFHQSTPQAPSYPPPGGSPPPPPPTT